MAFKITNSDQITSYTGDSSQPIRGNVFEILLDDTTIAGTDDEIDAALPEMCRIPGTIVYSADYSTIKTRNFDGEWVEKS